MPKGKGYALAPAGHIARDGDGYPGVVIVNTLPEAFQVDLFGQNGKIGLKKIKLSKALNVKHAIKIPAGDDRFKAVIHLPDGSDVESASSVAWVAIT